MFAPVCGSRFTEFRLAKPRKSLNQNEPLVGEENRSDIVPPSRRSGNRVT